MTLSIQFPVLHIKGRSKKRGGAAGLFMSKKRDCGTTTTSPPELCDFMFLPFTNTF